MALEKQYTLQALQAWFYAYRPAWWKLFSASDIQQCQAWLRQGLRKLEVHSTYLLVCGVLKRTPYFATLDLDPQGTISFHTSGAESTALHRGLLAAGLTLLEELFVPNLDVLTLPLQEDPTTQNLTTPAPLPSRNERSMVQLKFSKKNQSLLIEIFFQHGNVLEKLGCSTQNLNPKERELFLEILLQAQKYGFKWNPKGLLATQLDTFPSIIQHLLPKLAQKYIVECPKEIQNLGQGAHAVQVHLSEQVGHLKQTFFVDGSPLKENITATFLRNKHRMYWSDTHGLLEWSVPTLNWIQRINDWTKYFGAEGPPAYLCVSIFNPNLKEDIQNSEVPTFDASRVSLETLTVPLRPYQQQGVRWLKQMLDAHYHPLLADEMGLGKTRQLWSVLALMADAMQAPSLVVCPASVVCAWQNEHDLYFSTLPMCVLSQGTWLQEKDRPTIFVASYSQLRRMHPLLKATTFHCVILDEAQFIKNPKSQTARICFQLKAKYRIVATGTPLENRLTDLWSIFHFLMPGLLGHFNEFQVFIQEEGHQQKLKQQIAPFILRRTQQEVLSELPEKTEMLIYCPMTPTQKQLYRQMVQRRKNIKTNRWLRLLTLILRLRQICCDPGLIQPQLPVESSGKFLWLLKFLVQNRQTLPKVIIFSQFSSLLTRIRPEIEKLFDDVFILTGRTPTEDRRQMIGAFQSNKRRSAFLISLKAGGTGITLHTADAVFILDPWWNPAIEQQAIARAYRLGKDRPLTVYRLLIDGSIESAIQHLQKNKTELFNQIFNPSFALSSVEYWHQLYHMLDESQAT